MREIFSIRFFAAVGAVILSFLVVSAIVGGAEPVTEEGADADTGEAAQTEGANKSPANTDFQLARALDLLRGLHVFERRAEN